MDALFETPPPFIIKIHFNYFEITWNGSLATPEDKYPYDKISSIEIKEGKKEKTWTEFILSLFVNTELTRKMEAYDEILIGFKTGETETRYVHGQVTEAMEEAIEIIRSHLTKR
ncbi:MAG TPA: hypothetical protein VGC65_00040 [Bacteroidia bacterium]|jgi:hypothetical protein